MKASRIKGFTIVELIIVFAVIALLMALIIPTLNKFREEQALRNAGEDILSLLNEARFDTQASLNSSNYSVYIESNQATYFVGSTYSSTASTNKRITFNSAVTVPSSGISLAGGGSTITFNRLAGDTANYGTIRIQLVSDSSRYKTILISNTGAVSSNN